MIRHARLFLRDCAILPAMPRGRPLDLDLLEAALIGFEHMRIAVDGRIAQLRAILAAKDGGAKLQPARRKRRHLSAAARKRMGDAARARWAKFRARQGVKAKRT